jgi:hypothetical protein
MNDLTPYQLWHWLLPGYLFTVAIETPILLVGLSRPHTWRRRLAAGFWLNACSYPIVVIALPALMGMEPRWRYLAVAEVFAPVAECALFAAAFHTPTMRRADRVRDLCVITLANLASFLIGEWLNYLNVRWAG